MRYTKESVIGSLTRAVIEMNSEYRRIATDLDHVRDRLSSAVGFLVAYCDKNGIDYSQIPTRKWENQKNLDDDDFKADLSDDYINEWVLHGGDNDVP